MEQVKLHKSALLITATIIPNSIYVVHNDTIKRRNEYLDALNFYIAHFNNDEIYFLENSLYDFNLDQEFKSIFNNNNVHLLKFPVSDKYNLGKGYQEFEMIDSALTLLHKKYSHFIKITGRYKIVNLNSLLNLNCKTIIADSHKKLKVTQTNVFFINSDFYMKYFKNIYLNVNDEKGIYIEHLVYDTLLKNDLINKVQLFKKNPIIKGLSGSYGGTLNRNKYKMILRNIERKIFKLIGINQFIIEY